MPEKVEWNIILKGMEETEVNKIRKSGVIIATIHILLSLGYEFWIYKNMDYPYDVLNTVREGVLSLTGERIVFFIISKLVGSLLIFFIWQVAVGIYEQKKKKLAILLLIAIVFAIVIYPGNYLMEVDNLLVYVESINYFPDYWQSYLTGVIYNACLMVLRHSLSISIIQNCFFVGGIWYLSKKVLERWGRRVAWLPYLLLLFPEAYEIGLNPYRNDFYAIFCIWFFALLFFDWSTDKNPGKLKKILLLLFTATMVVMRGEGIILIPVALFLCFAVWELDKKQKIAWISIFAFLCLTVALPQKIGDYKYYGKDYQIVNYLNVLQDVFNSRDCNLNYDGAEEDILKIEKLAEIETIRVGGLQGYRANNYNAKKTVNQSYLSVEEQKEILSAANRLIINNLPEFIYNRTRTFANANGLSDYVHAYDIEGFSDEETALEFERRDNEFVNALWQDWETGWATVVESAGGSFWNTNEMRNAVFGIISTLIETGRGIWESAKLTFIFRCLSILIMVAMEFYLVKLQGIRKNMLNHITVIVLLGLWFGIFLFSPEGRSVYYYPVYYATVIWGMCTMGMNFELTKKAEC